MTKNSILGRSQLRTKHLRATLVAASLAIASSTVLTLLANVPPSASLSALNTAYTQDFSSLASSSTSSTLPDGWTFVESLANANTLYNAGTGSLNTGDTYSFGAAGSTDRALGGLQSGTLLPTFGASFTNSTGALITKLDVAYTGEEWRLGTLSRGADRIDFQYSTDATSLTTGTWTDVNALDFSTPNTDGPAVGARDGNAAAFRTAISGSITGLSIANGATIWIRWTDFNVSGADDGLAVDDFSLTPRADLSGTGTATPNVVQPGQTTQLSAAITPGQSPTSTGIAVSCNLTQIGDGASFSLPFVSGNTYAASYVIPAGTASQSYSLPCVVTDDQGRSAPFNISLSVPVTLTCGAASIPIHSIQGAGVTSPMLGQTVEVEGIVVGDFQGSTKLNGFYLQEPDASWDADSTTSEGVFVFDNNTGIDVSMGDRVRLRATVSEFQGTGTFLGDDRTSTLTELGSVQNKTLCGSGNPITVTSITLPTETQTTLENYEGMAVSIAQRLVVTGNFSLGSFGQLDLAPAVLVTPTNAPDPSVGKAAWIAQADLNARSAIALDDASSLGNTNLPIPTLFPQGGLTGTNTLRAGDIVNYDASSATNTPLIGVLDDRFGAYRIQPTTPVTFYAANPRPAIAPIVSAVGGRFRAVSANVLNFFTTFGSRGARNQTEFDHQKTKVIEALFGMNGDVYGLSEVQNAFNGNTGGGTAANPYTNVPLQSLVDGLNCKFAGLDPLCSSAPPQPFALIDTVALNNGTDAIRSAIIYRADRLFAVGGPQVYVPDSLTQFGNRPPLAQTFQPASGPKAAQQTFTFVVNHFRSKGGSGCGAGNDDALQGGCNGNRLSMAQSVITWLAGNPTGDPAGASRRQLLVGDFNAYFGEDPMQWFVTHGYPDLIANVIGAGAYSYNFGSQRGYLDHALVNSAGNSMVRSLAEWHNNADEPSALQALGTATENPNAPFFSPDAFAASDHDPILVGFNSLLGDLNDDGVISIADQQLMQAAIGRSAATVDRRMDYDGDGTITLNDYRSWLLYYRAFIQ